MSTQTDVAPVQSGTDTRQMGTRNAPATRYEKSRERLAWILIFPSILVVALVALYPLFETFRLSFTNARLASGDPVEYVGFNNYRILFENPAFIDSIWTTVKFTVASVTVETILGTVIALVINSNFKGRGILRASMLVPWAIPTVVSAVMWRWMFHDIFGVVNDIFTRIGLQEAGRNFNWLTNPDVALWSIVAVDVWKTTPFMALLILAGLQVIPNDVYEASYVDGATKWQQFWQITLPLLRPALMVALIFRTLDAFRIFDLPYVFSPNFPATETLAVFAREYLISFSLLGVGSAASVFIFICIGVLVIIYTRLIDLEES